MPATTDRTRGRRPARRPLARLAWFVGIWAASLAVVTAVSYGLRAVMGLAG